MKNQGPQKTGLVDEIYAGRFRRKMPPSQKSHFDPVRPMQFPAFISIEQYTLNARIKKADGEEAMSDSVALYNIVIAKMLEKGIQFISRGNSPKRNFILWFNSHFVKEEPYKYQIEIKEKHFNLICEIINKIK